MISENLASYKELVCTSFLAFCTGKSMSETLVFASTNPQYDNRLSIELPVQYMNIRSSEHSQNMFCTQSVFCFDIQSNLCTQQNLAVQCSELGIFM